MSAKALRCVIVGASTLLGKELTEDLSAERSAWDLRLADAEETEGRITSAGEEAALIRPLTPGSFENAQIAFFAGEAAVTRIHWKEAREAGAAIVDLTAAIEDEPDAVVRCPWIAGGAKADSMAAVVVPAHPAAAMLGVMASRLKATFGEVRLAATILEPASQQGSRGLDEMHQQTVSLLGFHALPQEVYDAQVAFNLRVSLGDAARSSLRKTTETVRRHLTKIAGADVGSSIAIQLVQAPVFHGYAMSVFMELSSPASSTEVRKALEGGVVRVAASDMEGPSNQSVTESAEIHIALSEELAEMGAHGHWLWVVADNLRLAAREATLCAEELISLRP